MEDETKTISYNLSYSRSVAVTEEFLKILEDLLSREADVESSRIVYECSLAGGRLLSYSSFSLLQEKCDNALERSVDSMVIKGTSLDSNKNVSFELHIGVVDSKYSNPPITGIITGEERFVEGVYVELDHQIRRLYKSKAFDAVSKYCNLLRLLLLLIVAAAASNLIIVIHNSMETFLVSNKLMDAVINCLLFTVPSAVIMLLVGKLFLIVMDKDFRSFYCPRVQFLFGDYVKIGEWLADLGSKIIWGVIIGIAVSVAGAFLYSFLSAMYELNNLIGTWL